MTEKELIDHQESFRPRQEALIAEAAAARAALVTNLKEQQHTIGTERDRVARKEFAAEQSAKSADGQARREDRLADADRAEEQKYRKQAELADKRGDKAAAEEAREKAVQSDATADAHESRARQATLDAAAHRAEAADFASEKLETQKSTSEASTVAAASATPERVAGDR